MQGLTDKAPLAAAGPSVRAKAAEESAPRFRSYFIAIAVLAIFFAKPLYDLFRLSLAEDIYSHILLIPFISVYLLRQRRTELPAPEAGPVPIAAAAAVGALGLLALPFVFPSIGRIELLSLRILSFCLFVAVATFAILGGRFFRSVLFPLAFLLFAVPLPPSVIDPLETVSKIASTEVYAWMMDASQSTYFRNGFVFALPGLTIEVAQECSGIRSSLVLFIVSVLAANLFLTSTWRRVLFCLLVIPLGFVRNAFRIFTLSFLSVHWYRGIIDSPLHHKGGPIFFALSLIPFCLVLAWLRKSETCRHSGSNPTPSR